MIQSPLIHVKNKSHSFKEKTLTAAHKIFAKLRSKLVQLSYHDDWLNNKTYLFLCFLVEHAYWKLIFHVNKLSNLRDSTQLARIAGHPETIYIIGTAPLINKISEVGLSHLKESMTIGLNGLFLHDLIPTFLSLELPSICANEVLTLIHKRYSNLSPKGILINMYHANYSDLSLGADLHGLPFYSLRTVRFSGYSKKALTAFYDFQPDSLAFAQSIIHNGGSLVPAIMFAALMARRRIVLVGIELLGTKNFYQEGIVGSSYSESSALVSEFLDIYNRNLEYLGLSVSSNEKLDVQSQLLHSTACKETCSEYNEYPVQESIAKLRKVFAKRGLSLEVASHTSLLLNVLDKAHETEFLYS